MAPYYRYTPDTDRFHSLAVRSRKVPNELDELVGVRVAGCWKPLAVNWYRRQRAGNFPGLTGHVPVFDDHALGVLSPLLGDTVEVLPLVTDDPKLGNVHAIHVLPILDCLDPARAEIERFDESIILDVVRYAFLEDVIGSTALFRIKGLELSACYVSEEFRESVKRAGLKGLIFKPLPVA